MAVASMHSAPAFAMWEFFPPFKLHILKESLKENVGQFSPTSKQNLCHCTKHKVSLLGVDSLRGDCTFIPADLGS